MQHAPTAAISLTTIYASKRPCCGQVTRIIVTRHLSDDSGLAIPTAVFVGKGDYSTSEVDTGYKWIDGKTIYKKTVNFGTLPNNGSKDVAHGISGADTYIDLFGMATNIAKDTVLPSSYAHPSSPFQFYISGTNNIRCQSSSDRTGFSAYVTVLYTKT